MLLLLYGQWDNKLILICKLQNHKQEIVLNTNCYTGVFVIMVIKRLSLYECAFWDGDLVSVVRIERVRIIEVFSYREYMGILPGPRELSVMERCLY